MRTKVNRKGETETITGKERTKVLKNPDGTYAIKAKKGKYWCTLLGCSKLQSLEIAKQIEQRYHGLAAACQVVNKSKITINIPKNEAERN